MGSASGDTTKLYPLAVVVERCDATRGRIVEALREVEVLALAANDPADTYNGLAARVLVVDSDMPGDAEAKAIRDWLACDRTGSLQVVLLGDVHEQQLPIDLSEVIGAYLRKPIEWDKVARIISQVAHRRRPATTSKVIRFEPPRN